MDHDCCEWANEHYGDTFMPSRTATDEPIVQRLFEAGIPGSVYWVYDGAFGMTLLQREGAARSWAEAEAWLNRTRA